ncbi:hypothetical protein ET495_17330 (plasmid) [Xylanimonas allomyrinae]|uniref:Uncharacterized protein n=1 Tax=Xylanimonas allomyrinae TaxID=2509459 RepID=A0A4P6ESL8_9MICO|nr:hypothetical protein [Xylanimonas allomyrinae]QAY64983.1 hypothetical protein ET495_17330 [Xylanimonas allomyrinae]
MSEQFTGARRATITATVTFDAYLMPGEEGTATPEGLAAQIAHELADAIAYRAGWTTDAEPAKVEAQARAIRSELS